MEKTSQNSLYNQDAYQNLKVHDRTAYDIIYNTSQTLRLAKDVIRFGHSQSLTNPENAESIAEHMWNAGMLWLQIKYSYRSLASQLDTERVTELLIIHDVGEIKSGDISRQHQIEQEDISSKQEAKFITEALGFASVFEQMPFMTKRQLNKMFDEYEKPEYDSRSIESHMANFIDSMHGDIVYYTYVDKQEANNDMDKTIEIVRHGTVKHFNKLLEYGDKNNLEKEYFDDLTSIMNGYCAYAQDLGFARIKPLLFLNPSANV